FSRFSDTTTLLQAFRASVSHTVADYSEAFARPTLLIAGDRDDITPLSAQLALQRRIDDSRLRVAPGVGHLVHYEAVDEAVSHIGSFLSEVSGISEVSGERA
ncbi:MAG: alpha/beta fold hydrolase, partial [Leucobacter sp.]